jgi:two-component sensor histidine kinase
MALIHEQLYQSTDLARIDFSNYIQSLAANLFSSYDFHSDAIALKVNVDNVFLGVDAAIPCGLIINELVSNSLKYAFPPGKEGEVSIDIYASNKDELTLTVSDNGIGFPKNLDFKNTESLGLQIVVALTNQLGGTVELNREIGTKFEIIF